MEKVEAGGKSAGQNDAVSSALSYSFVIYLWLQVQLRRNIYNFIPYQQSTKYLIQKIMKKLLTIAVMLLTQHLYAQHTLQKVWETDSTLYTPESVHYDAASKILYVSNIGDAQKPGTGFISKVGPDGSIIQNRWVTGLTAIKGLGLYKNLLYAAEPAAVAVIDVNTATLVKRIPIEGAKLLNDITIDAQGVVYVSDTQTNKVHRIENGTATVYLENMNRANGLLAVGSDLYILTNDRLQKADAGKNLTTVVQGLESGADGIEMVKPGEFVVTCWSGIIYDVKTDGSKQLLLDTRSQKMNTADLGFNPAANVVYIPTFFKNKVVAYRLK